MAKVTVDPDKIQGKNLSNVDDIQSLLLKTEERVIEEVETEDSTLNLAAIGAPYSVGPINISAAIGNLVLLQEIDSPFITGKIGELGEELKTIDCQKALYVLAKGKEAVAPIMAIKQRIQSMLMLKPMVEKNPVLLDKLMDRVESISEAESIFEMKAAEFYHQEFQDFDFQEVMDSVFMLLNDVLKTGLDLPTGEATKEPAKK